MHRIWCPIIHDEQVYEKRSGRFCQQRGKIRAMLAVQFCKSLPTIPLQTIMKSAISAHYDENGLSLVDILCFLKRQWRLIGGITIAAVSSTVSLRTPPLYQRSMTLQVVNSPLLSTVFGQSTDSFMAPKRLDDLGNWITESWGNLELASTVETSSYNTATNQIPLTLTASNPQKLNATPASKVITALSDQWQKPLQQVIESRTIQLEVQQRQAQQTLEQTDFRAA